MTEMSQKEITFRLLFYFAGGDTAGAAAHSLLRQAIPGQTSTITDIANTTVFVIFPLELLGF